MKYLSSDPTIMGGALCIKGTRIPIEVVLYRLKDGYSLPDLQDMYPQVDQKTMRGAIEEAYEQLIAALRAPNHA